LANSEFNTVKIQWLLHVPLGWTRWNSTLWPQSEFVRIPEQGPSISQYSINWIVSVTESASVYFAVGSLSLCNVQITFLPEREGPASNPHQWCCRPNGTGTGFSPCTSLFRVNIIPSMLNSHRRPRVSRITIMRSLGPFPKATLFWK